MWVLVPTFAAAVFLSVLVHELGHLVGGMLAGFRALAFAVWPIRLYRERSGWRCDWHGVKFLGGFVVCYPVKTSHIRGGMLTLIAGGPVASLLFGSIAVLVAVRSNLSWSHWLISMANVVGFWSLLAAVATFVPVRGQTAGTDGARIRTLLRGGTQAERLCALMGLSAASIGGLRPRDWDPDVVNRVVRESGDTREAETINGLKYNWLVDRGEVDAAEATLQVLIAQTLVPENLPVWQLEMTWLLAARRNNPAQARKWLEAAGKQASRRRYRCALLKAQAALAAAEGRGRDADSFAREALSECNHLTDLGAANAIRDYLHGLMLEQQSRAVIS